jgi:hypothetical protein
VRQLSDELSTACQKIIELQDCKHTEASMLAFLQDAISASHSHDSNRQIASVMLCIELPEMHYMLRLSSPRRGVFGVLRTVFAVKCTMARVTVSLSILRFDRLPK